MCVVASKKNVFGHGWVINIGPITPNAWTSVPLFIYVCVCLYVFLYMCVCVCKYVIYAGTKQNLFDSDVYDPVYKFNSFLPQSICLAMEISGNILLYRFLRSKSNKTVFFLFHFMEKLVYIYIYNYIYGRKVTVSLYCRVWTLQ